MQQDPDFNALPYSVMRQNTPKKTLKTGNEGSIPFTRSTPLGGAVFLVLEQIAYLGKKFFAFCWCCSGGGLGKAEGGDDFDQRKDTGTDDEKFDDGIDEIAVADDCCRISLGRRDGGVVLSIEGNKEVVELDALHDHANRRHDDVIDQCCDNFAEGGTDDHANGKIDNITPADESLEFGEDLGGFFDDGLGDFGFGNHDAV